MSFKKTRAKWSNLSRVAPLIPAPGGGCCVCQRRQISEEGSSEASPSHPSGPGGGGGGQEEGCCCAEDNKCITLSFRQTSDWSQISLWKFSYLMIWSDPQTDETVGLSVLCGLPQGPPEVRRRLVKLHLYLHICGNTMCSGSHPVYIYYIYVAGNTILTYDINLSMNNSCLTPEWWTHQ